MNVATHIRFQTRKAPIVEGRLVREGGGLVTLEIDVAIAPRVRLNDVVQWLADPVTGASTTKTGSIVSTYDSTASRFLVVSPIKRNDAPAARPAASPAARPAATRRN